MGLPSHYQETLAYLFGLQRVGIKYSLDNIRLLLEELGNPHQHWPAIHIAGTNGKGSTAAMLYAILRQTPLKIGLYTSPHLVDFSERIRVQGKPIPKQQVVHFVERMRPLIDRIHPSFFEVTTAMAFWHFAREKVDLAIVETGMGGRLDSTNVVHPLATIITRIGLDHQNYLGHSLESIAREKAGVLKPATPCICHFPPGPVANVMASSAQEKQATLVNWHGLARYRIHSHTLDGIVFDLQMGEHRFPRLHLNLAGEHQLENAILAIGTILQLRNIIKATDEIIRRGLRSVFWPGRLDGLSRNPLVIVDVSHNPQGFQVTLQSLQKIFRHKGFTVLTALQQDKNHQQIGKILAEKVDKCLVTTIPNGRMMEPEQLAQSIRMAGGKAEVLPSFPKALWRFWRSLNTKTIGVIIGSHYLAGEAYRFLQLS